MAGLRIDLIFTAGANSLFAPVDAIPVFAEFLFVGRSALVAFAGTAGAS